MTATLQATLADPPTPTPTPKDTKYVRGRCGKGYLGCTVLESTAPHHDMKTFYTCPSQLKTRNGRPMPKNYNKTATLQSAEHTTSTVPNRESHSKAVMKHNIKLERGEGNATHGRTGFSAITTVLHVAISEHYTKRTSLARSPHQMAYELQVSRIPTQFEHPRLRCQRQNRLGRIRLALAAARRDRVWSVTA